LEKFEIIAKTLFGFEELLAEELESIGATDIELLTRAVRYRGDTELLYRSNLVLRTAIKILKPIATFTVHDDKQLYEKVRSIDWSEYLMPIDTFAIDGITHSNYFNHSKYVALKTKDAIADQFRDKYNKRPSVDIENPDVRVSVHIADTTCTISLDSTGRSLGKRGYKTSQVYAPLSEVLAAGIILLSEWDRETDFIDPMCGSGTIPIEAALIARNIPSGCFREFTFENWNDFDEDLWEKIREEEFGKICEFEGNIVGYDVDPKAIEISRANAGRADLDDMIIFEKNDFVTGEPKYKLGHIVMNPPYGERLEEDNDMLEFYGELGTKLKHYYEGSDAWIISANLRALKFVGLRPSRKIKLFNGPLECRLQKFELYKGSKKDRYLK